MGVWVYECMGRGVGVGDSGLAVEAEGSGVHDLVCCVVSLTCYTILPPPES